MEPLDPSTLTPDQLRKFFEMNTIRQRNVARIQEIEQHGTNVELGLAHQEYILQAFVEMGILTVDQLLDIQKGWELHLRAQSKQMLEIVKARYQEAVAAQRAAALAAVGRTEGGLIVDPRHLKERQGATQSET